MTDRLASLSAALTLLFISPVLIRADETEKPPVTADHYRVYHADGKPATLDQLLEKARAADVVFLGESHDDPVAHHLEEQILRRLAEQPGKESRPVALSLEMFERDVQHVMDEYLAGLITEDHLKKSGRAWKNYATDYRPMVEFAKEHKLPVIAANAPRRYVTLVGSDGKAALERITHADQRGLPPLPYADASEAYTAKFKAVMAKHQPPAPKKDPKKDPKPADPKKDDKKPPAHSFDLAKAMQAQSLWDAGMAYSIAEHLLRTPGSQVLHVNGSFHTRDRLGTVEHLLRYRPGTSLLVVIMVPAKEFPKFDPKEMTGAGDFVIVTDAKLSEGDAKPKGK